MSALSNVWTTKCLDFVRNQLLSLVTQCRYCFWCCLHFNPGQDIVVTRWSAEHFFFVFLVSRLRVLLLCTQEWILPFSFFFSQSRWFRSMILRVSKLESNWVTANFGKGLLYVKNKIIRIETARLRTIHLLLIPKEEHYYLARSYEEGKGNLRPAAKSIFFPQSVCSLNSHANLHLD